MTRSKYDLAREVDQLLRGHLSPQLRADIRRLVAAGNSKTALMGLFRRMVSQARRRPGQGQLTLAAIEAVIDEALRERN